MFPESREELGEFDRRIQFQTHTAGKDDMGSATDTWDAGPEVWAKVEDAGGADEKEVAGELVATDSIRFTVRYSSAVAAISEESRILYGGRNHDIKQRQEVPAGRPRWIVFHTEKRSA